MKEVNIVIPSSPEFIGPIICFFHAFFKSKDIEDLEVSNVVTAVIEAIANAITHGNKSDVTKNIAIAIHIDQHMLNIEIQDEGNGFDVAKLPNPLASENLLKRSGRGIFLIKSFMDRVEFDFQKKGTKLIMQKVFDKNIE